MPKSTNTTKQTGSVVHIILSAVFDKDTAFGLGERNAKEKP